MGSSDTVGTGDVTIAGATPTVRERLRSAHMSDSRIGMHFEAKAIALDGVLVTDLDQPAPPGTRIVFTAR